jgi:sugar-specific transcriptional regulator TrmB
MEEQLRELGLTDNEVRIYLSLLENGSMNPYEIAEKTGFHRGYIYDTLKRMQEKGFVSSVSKEGKLYFNATSPTGLLDLMKMRIENLQKIVPQLEKISQKDREVTHVEVYKGRNAFRIALKDILSTVKENDEILIFGVDDQTVMKLEPIYLRQYFNLCKRKSITERVIVKDKTKTLKEAVTSEYRFLPKQCIGNTAFEVYGNKVGLFLWSNPNYLILIENKDVANSYRKQFDLLWKLAKRKSS